MLFENSKVKKIGEIPQRYIYMLAVGNVHAMRKRTHAISNEREREKDKKEGRHRHKK